MENTTKPKAASFISVHMVLISLAIGWFITLKTACSSFLQSLLHFFSTPKGEDECLNAEYSAQEYNFRKHANEVKLSRAEVEMILERLGIPCDRESDEGQEWVASEVIGALFEDEEPSLEEVKEAFDVLDENRDGYIDAGELKRVLCVLSVKEFSEAECQKMIRTFDRNGDGQIDFNEFLKLLENSLR